MSARKFMGLLDRQPGFETGAVSTFKQNRRGRFSFLFHSLFVPLILFFLTAASIRADEPAGSVLHLTNEGFLSGELQKSDDPHTLNWLSPVFMKPLSFPPSAVGAVHFRLSKIQPRPEGDYCFELVGGDIHYGNLLNLSDDAVEVEIAKVGRVQIRRTSIQRFYRWRGADLVYLGPNGLDDWVDASQKPQWREEGGQLLTDQRGASLYRDFQLADKAVIEFELSWKQKPDFVFALGVGKQNDAIQRSFRFEVWDNDLVVVGESQHDADVASVQQVGTGPGHVHVQIYLDQPRQRLLLFSHGGEQLAQLTIRAKKPQSNKGLRLTNKKGDVRLKRLRISRWNGIPPSEVQAEKSRIHRTDGSILYGQVAAFDPKSRQFTIRDDKQQTLVDAKEITDVFLSQSPPAEKSPAESTADSPAATPTPSLRVLYQNGSQYSGALAGIDETHLSLVSPHLKEPLRLPRADLRSLITVTPPASPKSDSNKPSAPGRAGRLEMEGLRLPGRLVDGSEEPEASCLVWQPELALNQSPLRHGIAGRIVYREPKKKVQSKSITTRSIRVRRQNGFEQFFSRLVPKNKKTTVKSSKINSGSLHLRSGDTIPCEVERIDEAGVTFKTPISDATYVTHENIKAIELTASRGTPKLEKTKRDRLLTLPRLLKDSPPTQLICAKNGDFLRGRVLEMNKELLRVEVRLETKEIARDRIAQIIWLHADELNDQPIPVIETDIALATRVQTIKGNDNRLTFFANKMESDVLSGQSPLLGACREELGQVDQLLFGSFIEQAAARLAYHRWKLHHATEPKFVQAAAGDSESATLTGTQSPLVGQAAPEFQLPLLGGDKFRLSDHKGEIVVLDFWATWCGPCLQTMPLVEGVVEEFAGQGVKLIAVNMEEQPKQITSMMERHKLKMTVVLDRDGVVATKYAVTAIPQTVVIDREGNVARLFVGGGPKLADPLRASLKELSADKPTAAAAE